MAFLLVIDTSSDMAGVGLFDDNQTVACQTNSLQKEHAAFLQTAIGRILSETGHMLDQIDAVAVTEGPGSYTGLRVGLASAKGICYALDKPLLMVDTLQAMALAAVESENRDPAYLFCPMIEARRDEVFAGIYDGNLHIVKEAKAIKLSGYRFEDVLSGGKIVFSGSGSIKAMDYISSSNAFFSHVGYSVEQVNTLAQLLWQRRQFSDIAYCQPNYLKAFYTTAPKI